MIKTDPRTVAVALKATAIIEMNDETGNAENAMDDATLNADRVKKHKRQAYSAMINVEHELMGAQDNQEDIKKGKGNKGETEETAIDMTKEKKVDKVEQEDDNTMMSDGDEDEKRMTSEEEYISDCSGGEITAEAEREKKMSSFFCLKKKKFERWQRTNL
eukprot:5047710-Ditylum_brightwellii.AAC.1